MKGQKNVCTYIASNEEHWRAKLLQLLCRASGMSESRLLGLIYEDYLRRLGLIDHNRKPVDDTIADMRKQARAKPGRVKLPHLPELRSHRLDAKKSK